MLAASAIDARGCGTRADLRNLTVMSEICERGDIILMMSDGVADNLDPEVLGQEPSAGGNWRDVAEVSGIATLWKRCNTTDPYI